MRSPSLFLPIGLLFFQAQALNIDDSTQWPVIASEDQQAMEVQIDMNVDGGGGTLIDGGDYTIYLISKDYNKSLSIQNGTIESALLYMSDFKSLSFSNSDTLESGKAFLYSERINDGSQSFLQSKIEISSVAEGLTFSNNGSNSAPVNAGIKSYVDNFQVPPVGDNDTSAMSEISIQSMQQVSFTDNVWLEAALSSFIGGSGQNASSYIQISNVDQIEFRNNISGGSLISSKAILDQSAERGHQNAYANIFIGTNSNGTINIQDNTSGDSLIFAHTVIRSSGEESSFFANSDVSVGSWDGSINFSNNHSGSASNGVIAALLEKNPYDEYDDQRANVSITAKSGVFQNNSTKGNGGVVSAITKSYDDSFTPVSFIENSGTNRNGINIESSLEQNLTFQNNHADGKGGALYLSGGWLSITAETSYDQEGNPVSGKDIVFKGNTMGDKSTNDVIANAIYVEASDAYDSAIYKINAVEGNRVVFDGSVISSPADETQLMYINYGGDSIPARSHNPGMNYGGTVLFTAETVAETIGGRGSANFAERYNQSRTSVIKQDVFVGNGTLAVQKDARLVINSLTLNANARQEEMVGGGWNEETQTYEDPVWTGNYVGIGLNTDYYGLIHVQGNVDLAGLADIDMRSYLSGTSAIRMKIDGALSGVFELGNFGNLYEQGLNDGMFFVLLTLDISDGDTDVAALLYGADRFNEGLGITDPDEAWKLEWVYDADKALLGSANGEGVTGTKSLVLYKDPSVLIPEPSTMLLGLAGMVMLQIRRRRRYDS